MGFMTPEDRMATERDIERFPHAEPVPWGESLNANAGAAWDWSILGRAQNKFHEDVAQLEAYGGKDTNNDGLVNWIDTAIEEERNAIPKEEWPKHEYYREGVEWDQKMNPVRAKILAEDYDERRKRDALLTRQSTMQKVAGFGVQLGVGFADPINYIPFLGQAAKLKMIGRFGSIGGRMLTSGFEAGAGNLLFNPIIGEDLKRRGEQITMADYAVDTLLGTGVGMLFGGISGTWSKHFRGETKADVLQALQAATLAVHEGRPVDVGPILKQSVERGQFNRERAFRSLTEGGLDPAGAETFLARLDGLAAAQGMDAQTWYRKHIADVTIGGEPGGEGIRFHAAMYRSPAHDLPDFLHRSRENRGGKQSYFNLGDVPERLVRETGAHGKVVLTSDGVRHVDNRHPDQGDAVWSEVLDTLTNHDRITEIEKRPHHRGKPYAVIREKGSQSHVVIIEAGKNRTYISTSFVDNGVGVENWLRQAKKGEEARMGAGGDSSTSPRPEGQSHVNASSEKNIHHTETIRKRLEELQAKARNADPLHVVNSFDDLPEHIRAHYAERGMAGPVRGVRDGRAVYIVAGEVESLDRAVAIWMHEQGIHKGLRGLVGDDYKFNQLMDSVFDHFGEAEFDGIRQAYGLDFTKVSHRREAAEEMLARVAEKMGSGAEMTGLERSAWDQIKAWLLEWLRGHGFEVEMTDEEIAGIVKDAVRWTMEGGASVSRRGPQRFSVDGRSNGSVEFLPDGRAHVRLFDGADLDQAGESLSRILSERFNEFPPAERLDWRTERQDMDPPDPLMDVDPEADDIFLIRDTEEVQMMREGGRLTEEEALALEAADQGVEKAKRISHGFEAAASCIGRFGL